MTDFLPPMSARRNFRWLTFCEGGAGPLPAQGRHEPLQTTTLPGIGSPLSIWEITERPAGLVVMSASATISTWAPRFWAATMALVVAGMSHRNIAMRSESPAPAELKISMKWCTTAGSLPPWVPGEEKQTSYAAPSVLQPEILVLAAVGAGAAAAAEAGPVWAAGEVSLARLVTAEAIEAPAGAAPSLEAQAGGAPSLRGTRPGPPRGGRLWPPGPSRRRPGGGHPGARG